MIPLAYPFTATSPSHTSGNNQFNFKILKIRYNRNPFAPHGKKDTKYSQKLSGERRIPGSKMKSPPEAAWCHML